MWWHRKPRKSEPSAFTKAVAPAPAVAPTPAPAQPKTVTAHGWIVRGEHILSSGYSYYSMVFLMEASGGMEESVLEYSCSAGYAGVAQSKKGDYVELTLLRSENDTFSVQSFKVKHDLGRLKNELEKLGVTVKSTEGLAN